MIFGLLDSDLCGQEFLTINDRKRSGEEADGMCIDNHPFLEGEHKNVPDWGLQR